ncbi:hypothetical protein A3F28_01635 [Candidatus Uhrbacteria bacterium RIFCSPHIGHO2_12_FULL_57_11]|uniref:Uncharacterized protein n=2 Tax=Candidatus Uhriibacteriota TaxID=1752732 RepID=A0A1F7UL17_9BACT|nr:MAG: hypothetical protein A3D72_01655 [Candidatus Uhrbacteria bacterium RIFCSPHIGHO2_02_FULL_57_19]OGL78982.1 MAG: hypothetical protein A3F28_01635 [Candidatus Uhrbacteria bacterium RIFCSPHIGHO2_12_FULL_57_11]
MTIHQSLTAGRWQTLSFAEQMANVGSEVGRAGKWQGKDERLFLGAVARALELLDLTIADPRWQRRRTELERARELMNDAVSGGIVYRTTFEDLERYFMPFAIAARSGR